MLASGWSEQEDATLRRLVDELGPKKWSLIATKLKSKGSKQCRRRWKNYLNQSELKTGGWTAEEDKILINGHRQHGNKWTEIAKLVRGRTDNAVKNRWAALCKRCPAAMASGHGGERLGPRVNRRRAVKGRASAAISDSEGDCTDEDSDSQSEETGNAAVVFAAGSHAEGRQGAAMAAQRQPASRKLSSESDNDGSGGTGGSSVVVGRKRSHAPAAAGDMGTLPAKRSHGGVVMDLTDSSTRFVTHVAGTGELCVVTGSRRSGGGDVSNGGANCSGMRGALNLGMSTAYQMQGGAQADADAGTPLQRGFSGCARTREMLAEALAAAEANLGFSNIRPPLSQPTSLDWPCMTGHGREPNSARASQQEVGSPGWSNGGQQRKLDLSIQIPQEGFEGAEPGTGGQGLELRVFKDTLTPYEMHMAQELNDMNIPLSISLEEAPLSTSRQATASALFALSSPGVNPSPGEFSDVLRWFQTGLTPRGHYTPRRDHQHQQQLQLQQQQQLRRSTPRAATHRYKLPALRTSSNHTLSTSLPETPQNQFKTQSLQAPSNMVDVGSASASTASPASFITPSSSAHSGRFFGSNSQQQQQQPAQRQSPRGHGVRLQLGNLPQQQRTGLIGLQQQQPIEPLQRNCPSLERNSCGAVGDMLRSNTNGSIRGSSGGLFQTNSGGFGSFASQQAAHKSGMLPQQQQQQQEMPGSGSSPADLHAGHRKLLAKLLQGAKAAAFEERSQSPGLKLGDQSMGVLKTEQRGLITTGFKVMDREGFRSQARQAAHAHAHAPNSLSLASHALFGMSTNTANPSTSSNTHSNAAIRPSQQQQPEDQTRQLMYCHGHGGPSEQYKPPYEGQQQTHSRQLQGQQWISQQQPPQLKQEQQVEQYTFQPYVAPPSPGLEHVFSPGPVTLATLDSHAASNGAMDIDEADRVAHAGGRSFPKEQPAQEGNVHTAHNSSNAQGAFAGPSLQPLSDGGGSGGLGIEVMATPRFSQHELQLLLDALEADEEDPLG